MRRITLLTGCLALWSSFASAQVLYDDFETDAATVFGTGSKFNYIASSNGAITLNTANPNTTGNSSAKVGHWSRPSGASTYPSTQLALYQTITDASTYASIAPGTPKISMKVYTDAPVGTTIMITLSSRTDLSYPGGAYTTFVKNTTAQNAWQTLSFDWNTGTGGINGTADFGGASATACGRFIIQMDGAGGTAYNLYFDDIQGPALTAAPTGTIGLYDNFESNTAATVFSTTASQFTSIANSNGAIIVNAANPSTTGNSSAHVGHWSRDASQYPNVSLVLHSKITNAYAYASNMAGVPKMTMKVYTTAPIGTEVLIRLDSATAINSYPGYVFTTFRAYTTVTNAWETLTFNWQPDGTNGGAFGGTSATDVSRFTVIIANGITTAYEMYIDDVNGPATGFTPTIPTGTTAAAMYVESSRVYPNPVSETANVELNLKSSADVKVTLTDMMGREVMTLADGTMTAFSKSFSVANLHKGIYTVNYFINGSAAKAEMLMVK